MSDMIREAPLGQIIRLLTKNRMFQYPEEKPDFQLPETWNTALNSNDNDVLPHNEEKLSEPITPNTRHSSEEAKEADLDDLRKQVTTKSVGNDLGGRASLSRTKTREETLPYSEERLEVEAELAIERTKTTPIMPTKTADGNILVDWYTTDDPANPQNWSNKKRFFVTFVICLYTFAVYTGSAIYTSGEPQIITRFNISPEDASLPLSLYVLAYGIGPLLFAPMSEVPLVGRNPVYVATFAIFVILCVPTALANSFAGLLVLRFLQGFFGSPCLANGGASMQDMYSLLYLPYAIATWVSAAYCGPALGPLLSGFAVTHKNWRWSLWEILWIAGPTFILMFLLCPETSTPNILLRRARRLRALTGDHRLKSQSEIDMAGLKPSAVAVSAFIKPFEIPLKDPAIAFVNIYTALVYGIYYSFFEVFPLVYPVMYHMSIGIVGVVFTCILVSCLIGVVIYCSYLNWYLIPDIMKRGLRAQEHRLVPALIGCFGPPIGLFLFAWTANPKIHWIASVIGISIYGASVFVVMQCIFVYGEYLSFFFTSSAWSRSTETLSTSECTVH